MYCLFAKQNSYNRLRYVLKDFKRSCKTGIGREEYICNDSPPVCRHHLSRTNFPQVTFDHCEWYPVIQSFDLQPQLHLPILRRVEKLAVDWSTSAFRLIGVCFHFDFSQFVLRRSHFLFRVVHQFLHSAQRLFPQLTSLQNTSLFLALAKKKCVFPIIAP